MKKLRLLGAVCAFITSFIFSLPSYAALVTINFDTPLANYTPQFRTIRGITNEFQSLGIIFGNSTVTDESGPGCAGPTPGNCIDNLMLFSGGGTYNPGGTITITFSHNTDYFSTIVWHSPSGDYIEAYDVNGTLLGRQSTLSNDPVFTRLTFSGIGEIHTVLLKTRSSANAWDDITFNSTVPIPASVWLFGSGLLGLVGMVRRKKPI